MANLTATSTWDNVLQLETTHQAIAGAGGTMNLQAQALANRTQFLADTKLNTTDFESTLKTQINASGTAPIYAPRVWLNFSSVEAVIVNGSGNVSSITDNGVGDYTVNFSFVLPSPNYSITASSTEYADGTPVAVSLRMTSTTPITKTTTGVRISSRSPYNGSFLDVNYLSFQVIC